MEKENYYLKFVEEYKELRKKEDKPKILLHVCCGACSCYPLIFLRDLFDITILFSNSNIYPETEYEKRLFTLKRYINELNKSEDYSKIELIEDTYNYLEFKKDLAPFAKEKEMGKRCDICIKKRLTRLFEVAKEKNFKYVTSVMSISRNKDANKVNLIGKELEDTFNKDIKWIYSDFKKNKGDLLGIEIARRYNIYRQNYCGCEYSFIVKKENAFSLIYVVEDKLNLASIISLIEQKFAFDYEVLFLIDSSNPNLKELETIVNNNSKTFKIKKGDFLNLIDLINEGIKETNSQYVYFLSSSVTLKDNFLSSNYSLIKKEQSDLILLSYYEDRIKRLKKVKANSTIKSKTKVEIAKSLLYLLRYKDFLFDKVYKRSLIENNSLFFLNATNFGYELFFNYQIILFLNNISINKEYTLIKRWNKKIIYPSLEAKRQINSCFLIKFYSIREKKAEYSEINYSLKKYYLYLIGLLNKSRIDSSFKEYLSYIKRSIKKLNLNTYKYENEDWETILKTYLDKKNDNFYKDKFAKIKEKK